MGEDWISVYSTNLAYQAEIMKVALAEYGIQAFLVNQQDTNYHFGSVEIFVKPENAVRARHILKELEH